MPQLAPGVEFCKAQASMTTQACRECVRTETRCAALLEPWRERCLGLVDLAMTAQRSTPLAPALAACSTVCTALDDTIFPNHTIGFSRPFLAIR